MGELISERVARNARELKLLGLAETAAERWSTAPRPRSSATASSWTSCSKARSVVSFQPQLDPKRLAELRSLRFIERRACALLLAPPAVGKSHIAVGLAMDALRAGCLVPYTTLDGLIADLRAADKLGSLRRKLRLLPAPPRSRDRRDGLSAAGARRRRPPLPDHQPPLHAIVDDRHVQQEGLRMAALLGDEILATFILDRLLHDAEVLTIKGPSWRLRGRTETLNDTASPDGHRTPE